MEEQQAEGPTQDPIPPVSRSGDPVEADPRPISGRPRPSVVVAVVAALAVAAVAVLVVVRVAASGDQGTTPAPDNQVVDSSAQSGQPSRTSGDSGAPTSGDVHPSGSLNVGPGDGEASGAAGPPGDSGDGRSSGSLNVGPGDGEATGPAGLPGDGGELPAG